MNEGYKTTQEGSTDLGSIGTLAPNQRQLERELERSMESLGLKRDGSARSVLEAERTYRRAIEEATMSGKPLADALLRASYRVGITSPHRQKQKLRKQVEAVRSQLVTVERKYQGALDQVVRDYEKILQDQDEAITARENAKRLMALLTTKLVACSEMYQRKQSGAPEEAIMDELSEKYDPEVLAELKGKSLSELRQYGYELQKQIRLRRKDTIALDQKIRALEKGSKAYKVVKQVLDNRIDQVGRQIAVIEEGLANDTPQIAYQAIMQIDATVTEKATRLVRRLVEMSNKFIQDEVDFIKSADQGPNRELEEIVRKYQDGGFGALEESVGQQRETLEAYFQDLDGEIEALVQERNRRPLF